ncbi:endonuclease V-like [Actinia tenebrosa]|uniref:Endonuclease V-like n=1 Tax=Actinia tenebrosa TaxID=6105 RepID=A0A6P8I144_ACTTE|nr:endonuclease V-like [Actinia tenebrosa]
MASRDFSEEETTWIKEQSKLKEKLIVEDNIDLSSVCLIGGVDISFQKGDENHACPGLVVLSYSDNDHDEPKVVYEDYSLEHLHIPYITNFLAFREVPLLRAKIEKLKRENPQLMPQVIMVDGNGVHHKRGFGIASHLGVDTDIPTIGVAKNLLYLHSISNDVAHKTQIKNELKNLGDQFPLKGPSGETTAMVLRTSKPCGRTVCKPIYVSVGHKIGLATAVDLVLKCCKYRIPEPTRQADIRSRAYLRENYEKELAKCPCKGKDGQS